MPNHVYNSINVYETKDNINNQLLLQKIADIGLCRYFYSPPPELDKISDTGTENRLPDRLQEMKIKHGSTNMYDWACKNWGTKWGCYDQYIHEDLYTFSTAWSPPHLEIIYKLAKLIPDFDYDWEEEQGFGARIEFRNGVIDSMESYDVPPWETPQDSEGKEIDGVGVLKKEYKKHDEVYKAGYYNDYNIEDWLCKTSDELLTILKEEKDEQERKRISTGVTNSN
tara:strand:- start:281 stop:955 length:675 start_codon:yes stop_codon:yes gene_type:complete